jgi:hypothetical protein
VPAARIFEFREVGAIFDGHPSALATYAITPIASLIPAPPPLYHLSGLWETESVRHAGAIGNRCMGVRGTHERRRQRPASTAYGALAENL